MEMYGYTFVRESDLMHHGIKGQKWGQRRFQNEDGTWTAAGKERYGDGADGNPKSFRGNVNRALAKVYGVNQNYYSKRNNKNSRVMASMNEAAKNEQLKKAALADQKKADKIAQKKEKEAARVDVSIAKNSATRRVAEDYHRLSDLEFAGKYHAGKKTFARRYEKTKGDTYSLGLKKQARAIAFLNLQQGKGMGKTVADIAKYTALSKAEQKALDKGHEFAAHAINMATSEMMLKQYKVR